MRRALLPSLGSLALLAVSALVGCGSDSSGGDAAACSPVDPKFSQIKTQVFNKSCGISGVCHQGKNNPNGAELSSNTAAADLVNVDAKSAAGRVLVVPGKSADSYLYQKITGTFQKPCGVNGVCDTMPPPKGGLSSCDIEAVKSWIDAGANDN